MNKRDERAIRARRAAARRAPAEPVKPPDPFRVLVAVHRPRYRSRAQRAVSLAGWEVRSLLNREDPIGLMNRQRPDLLVISVDSEKNRNLGNLRAAQRFRAGGMRVIGLFESEEDAQAAAESCDASLWPPWKSIHLRDLAATFHTEIRGAPPEGLAPPGDDDAAEEGE